MEMWPLERVRSYARGLPLRRHCESQGIEGNGFSRVAVPCCHKVISHRMQNVDRFLFFFKEEQGSS